MSARVIAVKVGSHSGRMDIEGKSEYALVFTVVCSSPFATPDTAVHAAGIPSAGSWYPTNRRAVCREVDVQQASKYIWEVTAHYRVEEGEEDEEEPENPLREPPNISSDFYLLRRPARKDLDGRAILNSAGLPFDPPPEQEIAVWSLTITRNEAGYDWTQAREYFNSVNTDSFYGYAPGECWLAKIRHSHQRSKAGWPYVTVTYEIHCVRWDDPDDQNGPWQLTLLDAGTRYWKEFEDDGGTVKKLVTPKDGDGIAYLDVVPLDGAGGKLADADAQAGAFVYLDFRLKRKKPFGPLGLQYY